VIDGTEALTAIDVNSGRSRGGSSQEDTAVATNVEAAREVARQLRLRDIGGLMVVDFIDMRAMKNRREVERTLREAMKDDRAKFTVGRLSQNGLLEINRQRLKKELKLRTHRVCPTCSGTGSIASPELVGLNILRRIETRAVTGRLKRVRVELHPELADAIQNDRRDELAALEREFDISVHVIAATRLHRSEENVEWFYREESKDPHKDSVAAVSVADLADGAGGRQPKKKKSERDKTSQPEQEAVESPQESEKPRRRRRGGRRRKKSSPATNEASADTKETAPAEESAKAEEKSEAGSGEAKPKRRPRRRRRRKKAAEASS
jgi:ribonuclease E